MAAPLFMFDIRFGYFYIWLSFKTFKRMWDMFRMNILWICLLLVLTIVSGCKDVFSDSQNKEIYGEWQLKEYCKPDSENSCAEFSVPKSKSVMITFGRNGKFEETYKNTIPVEYGFLGCGPGNFTYDGEAVYLQLMCMSSTFPRKVPVLKLTSKELVLKPFDNGEYTFRRP